MPVFAYKGYTAAGRNVSGTRDADNPRAIKQLLKKEGIFLVHLEEAGPSKTKENKRGAAQFRIGTGVSSQELAVVTRQLSTLIGAGIPLVDSLNALVDQLENPTFKGIWADVKQRVNEGSNFADALAVHDKVFTGLYVNMVRAGESAGALEVVLERLADFTESQAELRSKLIGMMIYPVIMICMSMGVTAILFVFVIPKIAKIFESQKAALPLPTTILIGVATLVKDWWMVIIPLVILLVYGIMRYIRSEGGRPRWHRFILRAPLFGPLVRMVAITRFAKTLGTLIASGVPLLKAFDIVKAVVENHVLMAVIDDARDAVKEGESIAQPLRRSGEFPPIVTHMIAVGERAGQLEEMLGNIARAYEVQVNARLQAMTSMLEPILIVFMGVVVGFIVFSILLPMMQISQFAG